MSSKKPLPEWQWNEIQQVGTDYTSLEEVESYDSRMGSFRNVDVENRQMLDTLALPKGASILEIGCGTGRFTRAALAKGFKATAIDVSPIMLEYLTNKAQEEGLQKPEIQHSGFLTMDFPEGTFDATVSGAALHHLPDAWKLVGLRNIAKTLKPGGQFILRDVIFTMRADETPERCFGRFVSSVSEQVRPAAIGHVKREYSTYDWIMEGLLQRGGFSILSKTSEDENFIVYHCRKA